MKQNKQHRIYILIIVLAMAIILSALAFFYIQKLPKTDTSIPSSGQMIVVNFDQNEINPVQPVSTLEAKNLPDSLIISPDYYKIQDRVFDFRSEGLYRIMIIPEQNFQRIVYKNDISTLLSSIAWLDSHGTRDDKLSPNTLEEKAKTEKIITTCGPVSKFAKYLLEKQNIDSRVVSAKSKDSPNGFDDSHTMIEVLVNGNWQVFDLDNNTYFTSEGKNLGFSELMNAVKNNSFEIRKMAADPGIAIANFKGDNDYDYSLYGESILTTDLALRNWYKRILGTPI